MESTAASEASRLCEGKSDQPQLPTLLPDSPACPPSCSQLPASCKLTKKVPGRRIRDIVPVDLQF